MTIPILPESAPFTPAQRAWVNGFFAGALGLSPAGPAVLPVSAAPAASAPAAPAESFPWHDPALPMDERLKLAQGRPPARLLIDLRDGGLTYEVGDALGVYPENCPELVDAILNRLIANGDEPVFTPAGQRTSAREALIHGSTITKHNDTLLELLTSAAADAAEAG